MKLAEMLILDGSFKLSALEAKLRMEIGGGARQGLRLGEYEAETVKVDHYR